MPRTPKPETTKLRSFKLSARNHEHIAREANKLGIAWGQYFNQELEFLRTGGLPRPILTRFRQELDAKRRSFRAEMKQILLNAAYEASKRQRRRTRPDPLTPQPTRDIIETSANIPAANLELLQNEVARTGQDFNTVLNEELRFARRFELPPELHDAALDEAEAWGGNIREWATTQLLRIAVPLMDVPVGRGNLSPSEDDYPTRRL